MSDMSKRLLKWTKEGAIAGGILVGGLTGILLLDNEGQGFIREVGFPMYPMALAGIEAAAISVYMALQSARYYGGLVRSRVFARINDR